MSINFGDFIILLPLVNMTCHGGSVLLEQRVTGRMVRFCCWFILSRAYLKKTIAA